MQQKVWFRSFNKRGATRIINQETTRTERRTDSRVSFTTVREIRGGGRRQGGEGCAARQCGRLRRHIKQSEREA